MTEKEIYELLEMICRRPRMYFEPIADTRDLIFFLAGVCKGIVPHRLGLWAVDDGFAEFLYRHFNRERTLTNHGGDFTAILFEEFGDKPLFDVCERMGDLFHEWRLRSSQD